MAPSQPMSAPPKVSRQPSSHPDPLCGECGLRSDICAGSMLLPYAAYSSTGDKPMSPGCAAWLGGAKIGPQRAGARAAEGPGGGLRQNGNVSKARADVAMVALRRARRLATEW